MKQLSFITTITSSFLLVACSINGSSQQVPICDCDTLETKQIISGNFNRIPEYDTSIFSKLDSYKLDSNINRILWYRDVENIDTTKFTNLWDDYSRANYHASHPDFIKFYQGRKDIELAFQFGPNMDLWAYHIFIIKKVGCCYLVTRSYFRHARFVYKAYSIMDGEKLDTLYGILDKVNTQPINDKMGFGYGGSFVDNRNKRNYYIDFEKEVESGAEVDEKQPKKEIKELYDFVDRKINWIRTYVL